MKRTGPGTIQWFPGSVLYAEIQWLICENSEEGTIVAPVFT